MRETTSTGRRVVEIGRARLRALPTCCTALVLRTTTNRVLAIDGAEVKQWDVTDGKLVARDTLSPLMAPRLDLVVSTDGSWVASGDNHLELARDGMRIATVRSGIARAFTSTNTLVIESKGLALVDPKTGAITHRLPKQPFGVGALTLDVAGDEDRVWWLSKKGYARWDRSSGAFSPITPACGPSMVPRSFSGVYGPTAHASHADARGRIRRKQRERSPSLPTASTCSLASRTAM